LIPENKRKMITFNEKEEGWKFEIPNFCEAYKVYKQIELEEGKVPRNININYYIYCNSGYDRYNECMKNDLINRARSLVSGAFKRKGWKKKSRTQENLGCDWLTLKNHIESQFYGGMNWDNRNLWHIDHVIPICSAKNEIELKELNHYSNLQPLWASDNISKGGKIPKVCKLPSEQ
jgi:hypothetical protein